MKMNKPKLTLKQKEDLCEEVAADLRRAVEDALDMLAEAGLGENRVFDTVLELEAIAAGDLDTAIEEYLEEEEQEENA